MLAVAQLFEKYIRGISPPDGGLMHSKVRVHELAKELALSSQQLLARLAELGEFVKSPSSQIEESAVRRIRDDFASTSRSSSQTAPHPPALRFESRPSGVAGRPMVRSGRPRREWYRGPEPAELTTMILDRVVIRRRSPSGSRPGGQCRYFEDEVKDAQVLANEWAGALLEGMSTADIVGWMQLAEPPISVRQALVLHHARISADDPDLSDRDRGPSLGFRLSCGNITAEQIVEEVKRRRGGDVGGETSPRI